MFGKRFIKLEVCSKSLMILKCYWNVNENKIKQYLFSSEKVTQTNFLNDSTIWLQQWISRWNSYKILLQEYMFSAFTLCLPKGYCLPRFRLAPQCKLRTCIKKKVILHSRKKFE